MKVKIINEKLSDNGKEFKVRRMNYDQVVVNYPSKEGIHTFDIHNVELISEGEVDDLLINHRELLKIRINRGVSIFFYKFLMEELQVVIEGELKDLNLLKDISTQANKRGFWEKELVLIVNSKIPIKIKASGQNFKRGNYNFDIKIIEKNEFDEICSFEIERLKKEIKDKETQLSYFFLSLEQVRKTEKNADIKLLI